MLRISELTITNLCLRYLITITLLYLVSTLLFYFRLKVNKFPRIYVLDCIECVNAEHSQVALGSLINQDFAVALSLNMTPSPIYQDPSDEEACPKWN